MADFSYYARLERMRRHHKRWLWLAYGRCCITLRPIGQHGKHYYPYEMHHATYSGDRLWWHVLPTSKRFHTGILHGILSGRLSAGEQRRKTGRYPNLFQSVLHWWGRLILVCLLTLRLCLSIWRYKFELVGVASIGYIVYQLN